MAKQITKHPKSTSFFDDPKVEKIYADPVRRARIKANLRNLEFLEDIARIKKAENLTQARKFFL